MSDRPYESFLRQQQREGQELAAASDILSLAPESADPPSRYMALFNARGLVESGSGKIEVFDFFTVQIWMPPDYLLKAEPAQVLTYLGPHPRPWHANIRPPFICLHLRPGTPLVSLLYALFETWTWSLFATRDDGLNRAAAQWARAQDPKRFPIDRRPLKRRRLNLEVTSQP